MASNVEGRSQYLPSTSGASSGWALFGGILLALLGIVNVIQGITLLQYDELLVSSFVFDNLTFWGWAFLIFGAVQAVAGGLTIAQNEMGPVIGIVVAGISFVGWFFMIFAAPAAAVIGMGVAVAIIASLATSA